jgi:hypothetical protein
MSNTFYFSTTDITRSERVPYSFNSQGANDVYVIYAYLNVYSDEAKQNKVGLLTLTSTVMLNFTTNPPLSHHVSCLVSLFIDATNSTANFNLSSYGCSLTSDGDYTNKITGGTNQFKNTKKVHIKVLLTNGILKFK